jgi:hypothetical protein
VAAASVMSALHPPPPFCNSHPQPPPHSFTRPEPNPTPPAITRPSLLHSPVAVGMREGPGPPRHVYTTLQRWAGCPAQQKR